MSGLKPSASLMPACQGPQATVPDADCRCRQRSQLPRLSVHSQSVHSEANDSLRLVHRAFSASATQARYPTFGNHRIYQLQHAKTESAPNVVRLFSAETECPPKVPICPHSAPKPKPTPKFGRPLEGCQSVGTSNIASHSRWRDSWQAKTDA